MMGFLKSGGVGELFSGQKQQKAPPTAAEKGPFSAKAVRLGRA
jgi:hypothetical protein